LSQNVVSFFELVADSSIFTAAFTKAKASALEFAASYKGAASSVAADSNMMGGAMERAVAMGALSPQGANAIIARRLQFYGAPGMGAAATVGAEAGAAGGMGMGGLFGVAGILTAILAPLGLVADGLLKAEETYAAFSAQILRNSEAIGINAQDLQVWDKIAQTAGLDSQSMTLDFERFGKNLADGAPALKATGVTLQQLGITSTDVGTAILQLADWMHSTSDESLKMAVASALFGRSGVELVPILNQGSAAFQNYRSELEKMGVIMSNSDLVMGARAQVAIQQFSLAFEAAKNRLLSAALPGFTMFFQELSSILVNNGQLWTQIGTVISDVVSFIVGMLAGITGTKIDLSKPPSDAAAAYQGLAGAANGAAGAIDNAGSSTKSLTDVIADQISQLQAEKRAQDELYDAQKSALQDQLDTLKDVVDTRRRQGEDIVTYERRLNELHLNDQIKAIDKQKTAYDRNVDDHIAALQREQQKVKEASGVMGADLASGISSGMNLGLTAADQATVKLNQKFADFGSKLGKTIKDWFAALTTDGDFGKVVNDLGTAIGDDLAKGMVQGLVESIPGATKIDANSFLGKLFSKIRGHAAGTITSGPEFAFLGEKGTEVVLPTYDRARSLALMEQSGMASLARSTAGAGGGGSGGGVTINVTFTGPVADELVASRVISAIEKRARQRGFALQGGFG
jgi:hypothetical protein